VYAVCRSNLKHALALTELKQDLERRLADEARVHDDPDTPHIHLQCTGLVSASSSRALVQTNAGRAEYSAYQPAVYWFSQCCMQNQPKACVRTD
jgi:hypothetical protein